MTSFPVAKNGEWIQPVRRGYKMECCDCGLIHQFDFRVVKLYRNRKAAAIQSSAYKVQFRAYRDD